MKNLILITVISFMSLASSIQESVKLSSIKEMMDIDPDSSNIYIISNKPISPGSIDSDAMIYKWYPNSKEREVMPFVIGSNKSIGRFKIQQ